MLRSRSTMAVWLLALGTLAAAQGLESAAPAPRQAPTPRAANRPNVVFIMMDDYGYGDAGFLNPESKIKTPHLDALAARGMVFTDAHTAAGVCTPARYAALTGRFSFRSRLQARILGGYDPRLIEPDRLTMASMLKAQGYTTAVIGKWHLGMTFPRLPGRPEPAEHRGPVGRTRTGSTTFSVFQARSTSRRTSTWKMSGFLRRPRSTFRAAAACSASILAAHRRTSHTST